MLHTLRNRLILSHILPLLIVIPVMGITLIYVLETRILVPQLTRAIQGNAELIAEISRNQPEAWASPVAAQDWLNRINPDLPSRVMFLTPDGRLLASTDPADENLVNPVLNTPDLAKARLGTTVARQDSYNSRLKMETIDVLAPVIGPDRRVIGIVRMTYPYNNTLEEFLALRSFIAGISSLAIISGAILGTLLALNISSPIRQVTRVVYRMAHGERQEHLSEQGPYEVKLLLHAVNFLVERLHSLEQARRQLLANLIHELGRPLGALRSANQAILEGAQDDPQLTRELLIGMDEEMGRLQQLLQSLTHLHDQVIGTLELNRRPVEMEEWLAHLLLPWKQAAIQKKLMWEETISPDLPTIYADPVRLEQALGNLVSNAIKYTPAGGRVAVSAGNRANGVWIEVVDSGPGISPEDEEKIFTPFYRGRQQRRFPQGMGLGLSIARDVMAAHGGRLELKSKPGEGSCFALWIPKGIEES